MVLKSQGGTRQGNREGGDMKPQSLDDTPLIPEIIAERITQDAEMQKLLCLRARWHYANQPRSLFASRIRGKNCDPRTMLSAYMDHWNKAGKERMQQWTNAKQP